MVLGSWGLFSGLGFRVGLGSRAMVLGVYGFRNRVAGFFPSRLAGAHAGLRIRV